MIRSMAFLSGFPGGNCKLKHRRDFDDEKSMSETGAFAFGTGSVFCGVRFGAPTGSFPWSNSVTYGVYLVYILLTGVLLWAPFGKKQR